MDPTESRSVQCGDKDRTTDSSASGVEPETLIETGQFAAWQHPVSMQGHSEPLALQDARKLVPGATLQNEIRADSYHAKSSPWKRRVANCSETCAVVDAASMSFAAPAPLLD